MGRRQILIAGIVVVLLFVLGLAALAAYVLRAPALPSEGTTPIPVEEQVSPQEESPQDAAETDIPVEEDSAGESVFQLVQSESEARFILGELLRGEPKTVVGLTDQVFAEILFDSDDPANTQVGVIQINARTFVTDNNFRNRAIQNEILDTGVFEFVTFAPAAIEGLPQSITLGETYEFQITGELTIRDIVNTETFEVAVTVVSEGRIEGLATAVISRGNYQLAIPSVPQVADVDEEVLLELEFVALPQ